MRSRSSRHVILPTVVGKNLRKSANVGKISSENLQNYRKKPSKICKICFIFVVIKYLRIYVKAQVYRISKRVEVGQAKGVPFSVWSPSDRQNIHDRGICEKQLWIVCRTEFRAIPSIEIRFWWWTDSCGNDKKDFCPYSDCAIHSS